MLLVSLRLHSRASVSTILTILRLEQLDGVTQFRSTLVEFLCNRSFHLALHDLQLRKRTLRLHFLEPFVEKRDLRAFRHQLRKIGLLQEVHNRLATALDLGYGLGKFSLAEKNGCLGARIHHEHVRPELLQAPGKLLPVVVLGDEREKVEIALRIAHHPFEIVDLKQAQVTMIILDAFLLKFSALLRRKLVSLALTLGPGRPLLIIF